MTPVLPCSISNNLVTQGNAFIARKDNFLTRCTVLRKSSKQILPSHRCTLPLSTSIRLFPQLRIGCALQPKLKTYIVSASGTDVAVQETGSPVVGEDSAEVSEAPSDAAETNEDSSVKPDPGADTVQSKRSRPVRKSEMPPISKEALIPGATFNGKVMSIQPFGAFVDFGAFTDGLVHVSRLSDSFVKDVADVVSIGQEVTVRLVEANTETGRISLTMRESDSTSKVQQQKGAPVGSDKSRAPRRSSSRSNQRRDEAKKSSKFVKGQELEGTVKNLTRSGAFISLPDGKEGFLPQSEEADGGLRSMMGESSLQAGQEVKVRVLRINRGQVTLTMKQEGKVGELDGVVSQGVVHAATNPFVLAFRSNKDISSFLEEQEKEEKATEKLEDVQDTSATVAVVDDAESLEKDKDRNIEVSDSSEAVDSAAGSISIVEAEDVADQTLSSENVVAEEQSVTKETETNEEVVDNKIEIAVVDDQVQVENSASEETEATEVFEKGNKNAIVEDLVQLQISPSETENSSIQTVDEEQGEPAVEKNGDISSSSEQDATTKLDEVISKEGETGEVAQNQIDQVNGNNGAEAESPPEETSFAPIALEETVADSNERTADPPKEEPAAKAAISPALVKQLREETGAGMMDCKKALSESGGDIVNAQEYLRKKGLASADKKASRTTAEGRIGSYIHDSRIGILIEVNCETDFVSRGDIFKELVEDLAMQVAACPQVQYLVIEDVPEEIVNKEREIEMQKEDLLSKPEQIRSKIVDGRIRKRLEELALLEQPFIKNDKMVVKDWVKQTISTIGENIKVKRFVRYNLGEGLEKKSQDFAAEVAAQTAAKPTAPAKEQTAPTEAKEAVEKPARATVSAALVKQLREETGAGMMDCKKALAETGGDLEKAQEYLRKKGLSTADKKSSRLAAEGRIGSYIHDARIGVLIEVNCETDFVGRSEKFKELVDDLAMQVAACPQVQYVSVEDVPASTIKKEKELEMQREDLQSKPENIRERIVEGRISKRLGELALLEQPFIRDDSVLVKDLVKQTVAAIGENIKVRRFVRFTLGEESEANE